ncbi:MAG: hypothetical protein WC461_01715 [Candidatus Paceibacterota bacterium]
MKTAILTKKAPSRIDCDGQFEIVKTEFEMSQNQMDKYDDMSVKIKTWAATLWGASIGWAFQTKNKEILLLGIVMVIFFCVIDAVNKNFRANYKTRRNEIADAMNGYFQNGVWPQEFTSPQLPPFKEIEIRKAMMSPHISLFYAALAVLALGAFLLV